MFSSLLDLNFKGCKEIEFIPFSEIDYKINARVRKIELNKCTELNIPIKAVELDLGINKTEIIKLKEKTKILINQDFEEVWHRNYPDKISGNLIDQSNIISEFLDLIQDKLQWPYDKYSYNKLLFKNKNNFNLNEFHLDHFTGPKKRFRQFGEMKRILFNLNNKKRYLAVFDIPSSYFKSRFSDPYNRNEYIKFCKTKRNHISDLLLVEIPAYNNKTTYGIEFDSFNTLHCGIGKKEDFAAVVSLWNTIDK